MRTPAPATLVLLREGIMGKDLADDLGLTPQAVSYQLAGKTAATSPELLEAIAARATPALADEIATLIDTTREKRTA